jgi:hypothetical protein
MPLDKNSYNLKLYNLLKTRGYRPVPLDSKGERSEAPQEADVFKFTFSKDDEKVGTMYATVEEGDIVLYYDEQEVSGSSDANTSGTEFTDSFSGLVRHLKHWAMTRQLGFRTEPDDKLASDMAQREYMKKKENISEGYYPMGKSASYNDAVPTVKIILHHTRQIQEGEQRFRHVNKIFLENSLGERILAPTIRPGIAQVYARHLAEGGIPNDERWNHIKSLCEDYTKMAGFVRAVKNNQFNESAQQLVNEGVNHYQGLRETLGRMRGHRGYNTYFESWTPTLMEDESSDNTLNELFVQETLDPRIESVLPILSKLRKTVGEMKEVNELAEWAEELTEAPGSETLANNEKTEKQRLDAFDLEESDDAVKAGQTARDKIKKPAFMRKAAGEKPATLGDVERSQQHRSSQAMVGQKGQEVEESGLQAYLGNKKYGKAGMDALRKAGRDGASKEKMANIRAKYDKLDEEGMEEGWNDRLDDPDRYEEYLERLRDLADYNRKRDIEDPPQKHKAPTDDSKKQADESVDDMFSLSGKLPPTDRIDKVGGQDKSFDEKMIANTIKHLLQKNPSLSQDELKGKSAAELISMLREGVAEGVGGWSGPLYDPALQGNGKKQRYEMMFKNGQVKRFSAMNDNEARKIAAGHGAKSVIKMKGNVPGDKIGEQGVAEDLDANQKRVGQLGPTEKVKNNNIGKLVGANESLELNEMDKSQPSSDRGGESSGNPYAKGGKATPIKAKDAEKDAEKALNKSMDKAHKKDVKEGQEDLDAILRIIRK